MRNLWNTKHLCLQQEKCLLQDNEDKIKSTQNKTCWRHKNEGNWIKALSCVPLIYLLPSLDKHLRAARLRRQQLPKVPDSWTILPLLGFQVLRKQEMTAIWLRRWVSGSSLKKAQKAFTNRTSRTNSRVNSRKQRCKVLNLTDPNSK